MKKSKRVMRRVILSRLYDYLQDRYSVLYPREEFVRGELPMHEVDALLAFKSDIQLEELRSALERLADGSYGICISCKSVIGQDLLDHDPTTRVCGTCEQKFMHATAERFAHHHLQF